MGNTKKLHSQAIIAREHEQDFLHALQLLDEAIILAGQENDIEELAGILGSRQNTLNHLFEATNSRSFLTIAKHEAMAAVEIAETNNLPAGLPYRDLAKAYEKLGDFQNAAVYYEKSINGKFPESLDRPSVKSDIKAHLAYSKYKAGDKSGLDLINQAIRELESADEQQYERAVWLSGAHMRTAEMLKADNPELAKEHLQKAKEIIDANPELKLRANQWQKLNDTLDQEPKN